MIATGSRVRLVPGMSPDTVDGTTVVTSKEIWKLKDKPQSVAIIGGGPIGVEFATVYRSYGCDVTIVEMLPRLVPLEDEEISAHLTREFKKRGINIMTNTRRRPRRGSPWRVPPATNRIAMNCTPSASPAA